MLQAIFIRSKEKVMLQTIFDQCPYMSERDRSIAELATRLALRAPADHGLVAILGMKDEQVKQVGEAIANFEKQLTQQNPTLSSLLASATKSKCCT